MTHNHKYNKLLHKLSESSVRMSIFCILCEVCCLFHPVTLFFHACSLISCLSIEELYLYKKLLCSTFSMWSYTK